MGRTDGEKTVLGKMGKLDAAGVVALAAGHKDTADKLTDLKKAEWYISREICMLEEE
jgi:hypothetical protein